MNRKGVWIALSMAGIVMGCGGDDEQQVPAYVLSGSYGANNRYTLSTTCDGDNCTTVQTDNETGVGYSVSCLRSELEPKVGNIKGCPRIQVLGYKGEKLDNFRAEYHIRESQLPANYRVNVIDRRSL